VPVSLTQTIEIFTHVLSGITINIIPDKELKYRTVRSNTGHLSTLTLVRPWAGTLSLCPCWNYITDGLELSLPSVSILVLLEM